MEDVFLTIANANLFIWILAFTPPCLLRSLILPNTHCLFQVFNLIFFNALKCHQSQEAFFVPEWVKFFCLYLPLFYHVSYYTIINFLFCRRDRDHIWFNIISLKLGTGPGPKLVDEGWMNGWTQKAREWQPKGIKWIHTNGEEYDLNCNFPEGKIFYVPFVNRSVSWYSMQHTVKYLVNIRWLLW